MNNLRLLEGEVADGRDARIHELEDDVRDLHRRLTTAEGYATAARREAGQAMGALRRQLTPLYRALQAVFGELDAVGGDDAATSEAATASNPRTAAVWESWKQKLGSNTAPSRVIDALLGHGELNVAQLKVAAKMANQTVYDAIHRLNKLGLINKNGGRFSLKQL